MRCGHRRAVAVDIPAMSGYTLLAAQLLSRLRDPRRVRGMNRGFGSLFTGAAILLASFGKAARAAAHQPSTGTTWTGKW